MPNQTTYKKSILVQKVIENNRKQKKQAQKHKQLPRSTLPPQSLTHPQTLNEQRKQSYW